MANMTHFDSLDLVENILKNVFRPMAFEAVRTMQPGAEEGRQEAKLVRMDVTETDHAYRISAELPGVRKEEVSVAIDGNRVMLTAESKRDKPSEEAGERVLCGERFYGKLRRSVQLPEEIDDGAAHAKYADGVLELTLPKKKSRGCKKLEIQ